MNLTEYLNNLKYEQPKFFEWLVGPECCSVCGAYGDDDEEAPEPDCE